MQGKNKHILRYADSTLRRLIKSGYSCLILGPRQVGKTTLVQVGLAPVKNKESYLLQDPSLRREFETDPARILRLVRALKNGPYVFIDECQKVPEILDAIQILLDDKEARFILTGSSARKLRRRSANLLPGRIKRFFLTPLLWGEMGFLKEGTLGALSAKNLNEGIGYSFEEALIFGSLPGIVTLPPKERRDFLNAYSTMYLEEEIRAEALSRKIGSFARFLELAAVESGTNPNFTKLSNEAGVSQPSIKEFYNILEETLIVEKVGPFLKNARKRVLSSSRYYFFDTGVRNALARMPLTPHVLNAQKGTLFEHAVMLEIIHRVKTFNRNYKICYWRTAAGAEVDCIIDMGDEVIPVEIKSSCVVTASEIKGLKNFLEDYKGLAKHGYVVTMGQRKERLAQNITAIPWFHL